MKYMKKAFILSIITAFVFMVAVTPVVYADGTVGNSTPAGSAGNQTPSGSVGNQNSNTLTNPLAGSGVNSVGALVKKAVEIFSYVAILIAVLALIWVGFQFVLARGDSGKMKELKSWLFWIVVGVAVVIGARLIVNIVINTLGASNAIDQRIIHSAQDAVNN